MRTFFSLFRSIFIAVVCGLILPLSGKAQADVNRPNIVFILTDDHRWDAMGFMGHPIVKTPELDKLRADGVHFKNAFVTTSLCSPSRATILTGTYAHTHGVIDHSGREINFDKMTTFPMEMQKAGYHTGFVGKWHMAHHAKPRPGFDYWLSFYGQGVYFDPHLNENGNKFQKEGYITDILTDYALDYIRSVASTEKPFCLYLSHKAMHAPFTPPARHEGLYEGETLPKPASWEGDWSDKPEWMRKQESWVYRSYKTAKESVNPPRYVHNERWSDYLRTANGVDESLKQVRDLLEEMGLTENTVIVYAGDNGFFNGEHRRSDKRLAYEESIRIPLIMAWPGQVEAGATVEEMVLNLDFGPTFLDIANVAIPSQMEGKSWMPLLDEAQNADWRDSFLYSYWREAYPVIPTLVAIRTESEKLVRYQDLVNIDEYYDLENDIHEITNLAQRSEHSQGFQTLNQRLDRLIAETNFEYRVPHPNEVIPTVLPEGVLLSLAGESLCDFVDKGIEGVELGDDHIAFSGDGVALKKMSQINPHYYPFRLTLRVKADEGGVVYSQGTARNALIVNIENGAAQVVLNRGPGIYVIGSNEPMANGWNDIDVLLEESKVTLNVTGQAPLEFMLENPVEHVVKERIHLGETGFQYPQVPGRATVDLIPFKGAIQSLKIER